MLRGVVFHCVYIDDDARGWVYHSVYIDDTKNCNCTEEHKKHNEKAAAELAWVL